MILPFHEDASKKIFENANALKKVMTTAEKVLWNELRNRKLDGHKFRRQHPVAKYIVDFYCYESKLIIEVDGKVHLSNENQAYDRQRTEHLEAYGIKLIRFTNDQVLENTTSVLIEIRKHLTPSPSPPLRGESHPSP